MSKPPFLFDDTALSDFIQQLLNKNDVSPIMSIMKIATAGRRPGKSQSRNEIVAAAQQIFAEMGYDRATLRTIATTACTDPALLIHFFASKQNLFAEAMAPSYSPLQDLSGVLQGDPATVGERLARYMVDFLEDPREGGTAIGLVRASITEPAATILKELFEQKIIRLLSEGIVADNATLRANFICSQYVGLVMARYINKFEPLASAPASAVVDLLAPTLQHYIAGKI